MSRPTGSTCGSRRDPEFACDGAGRTGIRACRFDPALPAFAERDSRFRGYTSLVPDPDSTGRSDSENPDTDPSSADSSAEWFRLAFGEFYLQLYAHRDRSEAVRLIRLLQTRFGLEGPVFDIACGAGRFLSELRAHGVSAAGLDLSRPLLREAARTLPASVVPLILGDMRALAVRSAAFRWVLLLFTSFGYFADRQEDARVLREAARVLRPDGRLALDFLNSVSTVRDLVPESRREVSGREVRETRWLDPAGPFLYKHVQVSSTGPRPSTSYQERVRLYSPAELEEHLERAGFAVEARLGDYDGGPFDEDHSERCLLIASKSGEREP